MYYNGNNNKTTTTEKTMIYIGMNENEMREEVGDFESAREFVGGMVERAPIASKGLQILSVAFGFSEYEGARLSLLCDEEGVLKGLPLNPHLAQFGAIIHGPVVIIKDGVEWT